MAKSKRIVIKLTAGLSQPVQLVKQGGRGLDQPTFPKWKGRMPERTGRASGKAGPGVKTCRYVEKSRTGCAVELDFLSRKEADKLGTEEGPVLRFCTSPKAVGIHVPVTSPKDAAAKAKRYCDCVGTTKSKRGSCAVEFKR